MAEVGTISHSLQNKKGTELVEDLFILLHMVNQVSKNLNRI